MKVKLILKQDEFLQISKIWNRKYKEVEDRPFFQSFEWNYSWYFNNLIEEKLFIILFYEEDYLQDCKLICPTFIDKKGVLRFISDIHSDFCDVLANNLSELDCNKITRLFTELIDNQRGLKSINFKNFSKNNSYVNALLKNIDVNYFYFQNVSSSSFSLENGNLFPNSAPHFKSSNRKRINKNIKKFSKYEPKLIKSISSDFPKEDILRLRNYMLENGNRKLDFFNDNMIETVRSLYDKGLVEINMVSYDFQVQSIIIIFKSQNSYQLWVALYMNIPHISVFTINSFLQLVKGDVRIDLGRGLYNFKIMNYAPEVLLLNEFFYSKSKLNYFKFIFKLRIKSVVKKVIKFKT